MVAARCSQRLKSQKSVSDLSVLDRLATLKSAVVEVSPKRMATSDHPWRVINQRSSRSIDHSSTVIPSIRASAPTLEGL